MLIKEGGWIDYQNVTVTVNAADPGIPEKLKDYETWCDAYEKQNPSYFKGSDWYAVSIKVTGTFNDDGSPRNAEHWCRTFDTKQHEDDVVAKIKEIFIPL